MFCLVKFIQLCLVNVCPLTYIGLWYFMMLHSCSLSLWCFIPWFKNLMSLTVLFGAYVRLYWYFSRHPKKMPAFVFLFFRILWRHFLDLRMCHHGMNRCKSWENRFKLPSRPLLPTGRSKTVTVGSALFYAMSRLSFLVIFTFYWHGKAIVFCLIK